MENFLSFLDYSSEELLALVQSAIRIKEQGVAPAIEGRSMGLLFLSPSLRTRASFESCLQRFGGHVTSIMQGQNSRLFELEEGVPMTADRAEHMKDAVRVLSRYYDAIGIRSFAELESLEEDLKESVLEKVAAYATVPVVSLESAMEHPCQGIADMQTIREQIGDPSGKSFVLSWTPHVKPLPLAVSHTAVLAAAHLGMNVTIACPEGYELAEKYSSEAKQICEGLGRSFSYTREQLPACKAADVVYAKSWGAPALYGDVAKQQAEFAEYKDWTVSEGHLSDSSVLLHCMPIRRGVVMTDGALDSPQSKIIDQAENRMWAQAAIMDTIFSR